MTAEIDLGEKKESEKCARIRTSKGTALFGGPLHSMFGARATHSPRHRGPLGPGMLALLRPPSRPREWNHARERQSQWTCLLFQRRSLS